MLPQWIIEKKRDGQRLDRKEIRSFIAGYAGGRIPDYQMSALAMAVYFRGMDMGETAVLAEAMLRSGETLDTARIRMPKVDKHSTGGVGDKVSLVLAPLVACCGIAVPMVAGRGLGITGGTIDKLESIPGYRTNLKPDEFLSVVRRCGCSIIAQTAQLAPADRKLYALRDVTGTVPSIPLIAASIMSKKLAEGIDALVLDVKWGKGAFMKTPGEARKLARTMIEVGKRMNKGMSALITDMNQPLGRAVGNAVEVVEAVEALLGRGPPDLLEVTFALASQMLILGGKAGNRGEALRLLQRHLNSGAAFKKFKEMVRLHGGDARVVENPSRLPVAALRREYDAPRSGYVAAVDAEAVGKACAILGASRATVDDRVDHAVGITGLVKMGEFVERGQPLLTLHANDRSRLGEACALLVNAFVFSAKKPSIPPLVTDRVISL